MKTRIFFLVIPFILLLVFTLTTSYETSNFDELDINHDRLIDRNESLIMINTTFPYWDLDQDGYVNENEFNEVHFASWDKNKDYIVDGSEWHTQMVAFTSYTAGNSIYEAWDTDKSGFVDIEEFCIGMDTYGIFTKWDINHDLFLDEFEMAEGIFMNMDNDYNSFIDNEEFMDGNIRD